MKKGYCNGSDLLLLIRGKAVGHCTSHTTTFNTETKDHAVKPPASQKKANGKFKEKTVSGLSYSVKSDGLYFYDEEELGYEEMLDLWAAGEPVEVKCVHRSEDTEPYLEGDCIIDSLERTAPANDDATYSISLSNTGAPKTLNKKAFTDGDAPEEEE